MGTDHVIQLEHVTKSYGKGALAVTAVADLTLRVTDGEFASIMGPSGSGKTTLLNLIAGLDTPTDGRVELLGRDIGTLSDKERSRLRLRQVGIVFQTFNLFPTFTAEENVVWPLEFLGVRTRVALERARASLRRVGIGERERSRRPAALSQGEQQRIAMARALVTEPRVLLADEPTGNLDSQTGKMVLDLLRDLNRELALSVVLVTHSAFAARYASRTVEMRDGSIHRDTRTARQAEEGGAAAGED